MADATRDEAARILQVLADLAPSGEPASTRLRIPTEWFRWLDVGAVGLFAPGPAFERPPGSPIEAVWRLTDVEQPPLRTATVDRNFGERLAAVDQIRPEQRSLRVGWLFLAGRTPGPDGRPRRVFHPLVTLPVRVDRRPGFGGARLVPAGDVEITELVADRDQRYRLESEVQYGGGALEGLSGEAIPTALLGRLGGLRRFARAVASAAGLPAGRLVPANQGPEELMRGDGLVIVAGAGVFAAHETGTASRSGSLRAWAAGPLDRWTAFHSMYLDAPPPDSHRDDGSLAVESAYLLTPVQEQAVVRSRRDSVTLISGAPGTGKSHTVVAIACDALARGESVLVAAKSDATIDALLDLLERAPGPDPVVFGSSERREALAARLAAGQHRRLQDVLDAHGVSARPVLAARLDVRRNSAFDVAAGVAPVVTLDEHFRSDPHLIDFVADRIYGGALHVATRAPSTASRDCVKVVRTGGCRDRTGVVAAEVEWVVRELERLRALGARSVGVITPFRAQADALEAAVLGRFSTDDLETLDLRVGTVHAFQGNERDVVVASLGVGPDQDNTSWRFVEDPHLFAVLVTRARRHFTVLVSGDPPAGGLVSAYLAQADTPPGPPPGGPPASRWVEDVADGLRGGGVPVITSYPCGRHLVDVCVERPGDVAIEAAVHADGPEAHVTRHLALMRLGWTVLEAFPSRWSERRGELVIDLLARVGAPSAAP